MTTKLFNKDNNDKTTIEKSTEEFRNKFLEFLEKEMVAMQPETIIDNINNTFIEGRQHIISNISETCKLTSIQEKEMTEIVTKTLRRLQLITIKSFAEFTLTEELDIQDNTSLLKEIANIQHNSNKELLLSIKKTIRR